MRKKERKKGLSMKRHKLGALHPMCRDSYRISKRDGWMALEVCGVPPPLTMSLDFRTTLRTHAPRIKSIKGNDSPINLARHRVKISRSKIHHFWEGEKREGKQFYSREIVISYYFQG